MREAHLYRYSIPIQTGVILRTQILNVREGLILHLKDHEHEGWGEIAPLPSFSQETLEVAKRQVEQWLDGWLNGEIRELEKYVPSVACGISFALAELDQTLIEKGNYCTALLCDGERAKWQAKLEKMAPPVVAKLKIGREAPDREGEKVAEFLANYPQVRLRLDANSAWSLSQAVEFAEKIAKPLRSQIEFIEEPCHLASISADFASQTNIAIAWDETLREQDFSFDVPNLAAIVIKPTLMGSREKCLGLIQQAEQRGLRSIISSSLESSLALTQFARFAGQHTIHETPGLDTLQLMPIQLLREWPNSDLPCLGFNSSWITQIR